MIGINTHREYESGRAFEEFLSKDLKDTLTGWKAQADEYDLGTAAWHA